MTPIVDESAFAGTSRSHPRACRGQGRGTCSGWSLHEREEQRRGCPLSGRSLRRQLVVASASSCAVSRRLHAHDAVGQFELAVRVAFGDADAAEDLLEVERADVGPERSGGRR